jgi:hypothetical protein
MAMTVGRRQSAEAGGLEPLADGVQRGSECLLNADAAVQTGSSRAPFPTDEAVTEFVIEVDTA